VLWFWYLPALLVLSELSSLRLSHAVHTKVGLQSDLVIVCAAVAQGEFVDKLAELVIKTYGASNSISKGDIYMIQDKKKIAYFDEGSEDDE